MTQKARLGRWLDKGLVRLGRRSLYWQVFMLIGLVCLLVLPLFGAVPQYHWQTPWNNGQLFSEWVLWAIWYPGTLLSVLLVGRLWCGILCPLGAMSEWFSHIGARFPIPRFIKHPMTTAMSFIWVTIWAQTLDVRDDLRAALLLFALIFALAVGCGLLFGSEHKQGRRVWCRHLCPIGSILGVFSRLGVVNLVRKHAKDQTSRISEGYRDNGLCPTSIDLATKQTARHCIKCARCVNPESKGGLTVQIRQLGTEIIEIDRHAPCLSELWFIWLAPGLAVAGFVWAQTPLYVSFRQALGQFALSQHWYGWLQAGPSWLMNQNAALNQHYLWLDFFSISGFMLGFALLLAVPLLLCSWLASYAFHANQIRRSQRMAAFGYQFAPMAMLCILLGLGSTLFATLKQAVGNNVMLLELGLLVMALLFNGVSAWRWTAAQNVSLARRILLNGLLLIGCALLSVATLWSIFPTLLFH
ncbi:4Fe-4S binding protein [Marinomonas spartinae]|uniref:4Fe-4S binding protein n=1 Tax=Marinomonas spartinae TaxID=1792290 RepID=UPI0018F20D69|nr:4Fe-4S binding protein [Marinomonas spartinae]MBJ7553832.1 4Fe-4S binding protein [Marinomonas spartinae]